MPTAKYHSRTTHSISIGDRELEIDGEPYNDSLEVRELANGHIVLGWLRQDGDCQHPLDDCDGMGNIYSAHDGGREDLAKMKEALGLTQYGDPDTSGVDEAEVDRIFKERHGLAAADSIGPGQEDELDQIAIELWKKDRDPLVVVLDVYDHSGCHWSISGSAQSRAYPDQRWDVSHGAGVWVPDHACRDHIRYSAREKILPEGTTVAYESKSNPDGTCITRPCKPGEKSYFINADGTPKNEVPDERYHNVITYTLPDGRKQGGFKDFAEAIDAAAQALGISLDPKAIAAAERAEALVCAQQALDSYNSWLSGDCWGVCVAVFNAENDGVEDESCWGHIGSDYAEKERDGWIERLVKEYEAKT